MISPDTVLSVAVAPKRNSPHWDNTTITWGEICAWVEEPARVKEAGNYLLGELRKTPATHTRKDKTTYVCTKIHRTKPAVVSRSALTLDIDSPAPGFIDRVELLFEHAALVHTTFNSTPSEPRYRMIVPTDRAMEPDEYVHAAEALMQKLGHESFDPGSSQPERYMFKPAAQRIDWFESWILEGETAPVDELLADYTPDLSTRALPDGVGRHKRDPFELEDPVGAFNRVYTDLDQLIEVYELPYEPSGGDRWALAGSVSVAGLGWVTEGLLYSHHSNDPAHGQACSAFDLVRIHRFGGLDADVSEDTPVNRLPSDAAMRAAANNDPRVLAEMVQLDFDDDFDFDEDDGSPTGPNAWLLQLTRTRAGVIKETVANWDLVAANYPVFGQLYYNELTTAVEFRGDLPWRAEGEGSPSWTDTDTTELKYALERDITGFTPIRTNVDDRVDTTAKRRRVNNVRTYLEGLVWDGTERLETCLPGVKPTRYTRIVARKSLVAAVARMFEPGVKWDHSLILYGPEGLGKSLWIQRMARADAPDESRGYAKTLGDIKNKDTLMVMQRAWIMIADEGHSLKKADNDALKEFLTKTEDTMRSPYGRTTEVYPRHCVIWGTTNDPVFLRNAEGNRRYLVVHCEKAMDYEAMTSEYIDQVWAEAVHLYREGEQLFLTDDESDLAREERKIYTEENAKAGLIEAFLSRPVPPEYEEWPPERRQQWQEQQSFGGGGDEGTQLLNRVCTSQIWVEAFGNRKGDHRRLDLLEIGDSLREIGWIPLGQRRTAAYGPQTVYKRPPEPKDDF